MRVHPTVIGAFLKHMNGFAPRALISRSGDLPRRPEAVIA